MKKLWRLLKIFFVERRLPSRLYQWLVKRGIRFKTIKVPRGGLVFKCIPRTYWIIDEVRNYDIPGFRIEPGMCILDVGANQGFYAVRCAYRGANVYCFEPFEENYSILSWNVRRNRLKDRVHSFNVAVSDKDGHVELFVPIDVKKSGPNVAQISTNRKYIGEEKLQCTVKTVKSIDFNRFLDKQDIQKWDILKIDIEGDELKVLKSLSSANLNKMERIVLETHSGYEDDEVVNLLTKAGLSIVKHIRGHTGFISAVRSREVE